MTGLSLCARLLHLVRAQRTHEAAIQSATPFVFTACRRGIWSPSLKGSTARTQV